MDSFGAGGLSAFSNSDPKTQIMRQVQQEAAMQNARMLVEVRSPTRILVRRVVKG
jgi:import inner membrane translocase subunit TIM13